MTISSNSGNLEGTIFTGDLQSTNSIKIVPGGSRVRILSIPDNHIKEIHESSAIVTRQIRHKTRTTNIGGGGTKGKGLNDIFSFEFKDAILFCPNPAKDVIDLYKLSELYKSL